MLQTHTNAQNSENARLNLVTVGLAGIIAGAAGITALALSDKDIRKKVGKRAKEAKDALQKWSTEKLMVVDHHDQDTLERESKKAAEEVTQMHEEKLHN